MIIRGYRPADEPAAYEVCLRTGDNGADATGRYRDPSLLGHLYVGPYLHYAPEHALMLDGGERGVVGYALGVPDTVAFEQWCAERWWPALRARLPDPDRVPAPERTPDQRLAHLIHHPYRTPAEVTDRFPAHLHIDLLPETQGRGWGAKLLHTLFESLAAAGAPGVHLGVALENERAIGFYRRIGFTDLRRDPDGLIMSRPLP